MAYVGGEFEFEASQGSMGQGLHSTVRLWLLELIVYLVLWAQMIQEAGSNGR